MRDFLDSVETYNSSLTRGSATALVNKKSNHSTASNENYALIAGGYSNISSMVIHANVDNYSPSLTRGAADNLSAGRKELVRAMDGEHVLFAGVSMIEAGGNSLIM